MGRQNCKIATSFAWSLAHCRRDQASACIDRDMPPLIYCSRMNLHPRMCMCHSVSSRFCDGPHLSPQGTTDWQVHFDQLCCFSAPLQARVNICGCYVSSIGASACSRTHTCVTVMRGAEVLTCGVVPPKLVGRSPAAYEVPMGAEVSAFPHQSCLKQLCDASLAF